MPNNNIIRNRIRTKYRGKLISYGILPKQPPFSKEHEEIFDMIKADSFDYINILIIERKKLLAIEKKKQKEERTKIISEEEIIRRKQTTKDNYKNIRLAKLINAGILPISLNNLNEIQKKIYVDAVNNNKPPYLIINDNLDYANIETKQKFLYNKIKINNYGRRGRNGITINIRPEDIIINDYCPFMNEKITYKHTHKITSNGYSIDRIDNSKGYIKGNVWVISKLANAIKNSSLPEELKTFCTNIILMYGDKTNSKL